MAHENTAVWAEHVRENVDHGTSFSALGTSDHEASLPGTNPQQHLQLEQYLFFGKKQLASILAEELLNKDVSTLEGHGLDAKLETMISGLSYGELLESLRARSALWCLEHALQTPSTKERFLYLVAKAFAGGPQIMQHCIRGLLITNVARPLPEEEASSLTSGESEASSESGESRGSTPPSPDMIDMMPRYTSALHEWCARERRPYPSYAHSQLTLHPSTFVATVSVAGEDFQGSEQPKKKWAEHAASWEACRSLNVEPI